MYVGFLENVTFIKIDAFFNGNQDKESILLFIVWKIMPLI